jgi:hypothetical protein
LWWKVPDVYNVKPVDLNKVEDEVRRREDEWRGAGAVSVIERDIEEAQEKAERLHEDLNQAKARSRRGLRFRYLNLVRLFVLTRIPCYGKTVVIASSATIICALSLLITPFLYSSMASASAGASIMLLSGTSLVTATILLLWPTEHKRQAFQRLHQQLKQAKEQLETLRPALANACADRDKLRRRWTLCNRLKKAPQRRDALAALLTSAKYKLMNTDWRSLRAEGFEDFLLRVFEMLGYQVQKTGPPQQKVDLLVTGKGKRIAVEAKGREDNVDSGAVSGVFAGMTFYGCDSCVVITNSGFTRAAISLASATNCRLIDGSQIPDLIDGKIY